MSFDENHEFQYILIFFDNSSRSPGGVASVESRLGSMPTEKKIQQQDEVPKKRREFFCHDSFKNIEMF